MEPTDLCVDCILQRPRNRWGTPLPKKNPDNMGVEHIEETLRIHPWLRGTRLGALVETLRDAMVMGA